MTHAHHTAHGEHNAHEGHVTASFLKKFWIALVLTIPIFFYSEMAHMLLGVRGPVFFGWQFAMLAIGSVVFFYCGWIFIASAYRELRAKLPGMMTLISMAIAAAYAYSFFSIVFGSGPDLLFELSSLITIMLLGHWIEMKSVQRAKGALQELAKLLPDTAEVLRNGVPITVALSELREGDIVLIRPGGKVPADGVVIEGESDVDESLITGESRPVPKQKGSNVIAGAINGDGSLSIRLEKIGEHTFLSSVMRMVAEAESSKSRLQLLSDRAAFYLTIIAVIAGAATFIAWYASGAGLGFAVERLVAVLVIACPHALGLAIPLVASISTTLASKSGFFVRRRLALEAARNITTVLFDKTGTLTEGRFGVVSVVGIEAERALALAGAANAHSEHPLGRAIVAHAASKNVHLPKVSSFSNLRGKGVRAVINGEEVAVGSSTLLQEHGIQLPENEARIIAAHEREGKTVVHVISQNAWIGSVALADIMRQESRVAVNMLKRMGIKVAMITGDSEDVAAWVSRELGIDEYFARVLPSQKAQKVKELQDRGERVAMVGDGVNDAPALTKADLGIAIGAGTNVAIESAGIILVKNDPRDIPKIISLSRLTYAKMIQNLFWASGYNIIALPLAAGALYVWGVVLEPAIAAVLMSASTVIVAINAILLRKRTL